MNKKYITLLTGIFIVTSCINTSLQPDVVSRSDVQKQQYVVFGVISEITNVTIEGDRELGAGAGLVIGGAIGKDSTDSDLGSDIATVVGGLIGSAIGSEVGSSISKKEGVELLIETNSGNFISIIQEVSKFTFSKGQKVQIIKRNGKSRVIPFE